MNRIKKKLTNTEGVAMPAVIFVMVILSVLATAIYMFAYNQYINVRYMNSKQRAYYFARAGVEAASYAYQIADNESVGDEATSDLISMINYIKTSETAGNNAIITTQTVYIAPSKDAGTGRWKGISFSATPSSSSIGEFQVQIGNGIEIVDVTDSAGNKAEQANAVKVFRSTGVSYNGDVVLTSTGARDTTNANDSTRVVTGYLAMTETAAPLAFYDDNGVLTTNSYTTSTASNYSDAEKTTMFLKTSHTVDISGTDLQPSSNHRFFLFRFLEILRKSIIKSIFEYFYGSSVTIDLYTKTSTGNLILAKPENSDTIKTRSNANNYYIFASAEDLFVKGCGINAIPDKGYYNSVGLYGDEIVVDGNISMGVYYTKQYTVGGNAITTITDSWNALTSTFGNRYRLGTVMLGEGSNGLTSRTDPLPVEQGGLKYNGVAVPANKVYFNGNVIVKIFNQGGQTEVYRVFNAGDMAYFYGGYTEEGSVDGEDTASKGVDLLKYFIDAVIDGKEGYNYGSALKQKMKAINELYYTGTVEPAAYNTNSSTYTYSGNKYEFDAGDPTPYFNADTVLVRKIIVDKTTDGQYVVDNGCGSVLDIIQPTEMSEKYIKWGEPEGGSVFNPKGSYKY